MEFEFGYAFDCLIKGEKAMSADSVRKFLELAHKDSELLKRIKGAVADRGEASSFELVDLAAGYGYQFTATELVEQLVGMDLEEVELSEVELEAVTGGLTSGTGSPGDIRAHLGRIKKTMTPGLMTKRESEPPEK